MRNLSLAALAVVASSLAFAQAPSSTTPRTGQEHDATKSGGMPAEKAQAKTDMKKDATPMSPRMKSMDTNGDGMISQAEWNAYHTGMWGKMKKNKGMVSAADVEAAMAGGPN